MTQKWFKRTWLRGTVAVIGTLVLAILLKRAVQANDAISSMSAVDLAKSQVATKAAVQPQARQQAASENISTSQQDIKPGVIEGGSSTYAGDEAVLNELDKELDGLLNDLDDSKQDDAGLIINQTP